MAHLDNNIVPTEGTTFYVGSWVFVANGSGGFNSHLIDPSAPKILETSRRQKVDDFIDQLDEILLPIHVNDVRNQPNFDVAIPKALSEMEEDLDNLLEITRQEAIVDREAPVSEYQ